MSVLPKKESDPKAVYKVYVSKGDRSKFTLTYKNRWTLANCSEHRSYSGLIDCNLDEDPDWVPADPSDFLNRCTEFDWKKGERLLFGISEIKFLSMPGKQNFWVIKDFLTDQVYFNLELGRIENPTLANGEVDWYVFEDIGVNEAVRRIRDWEDGRDQLDRYLEGGTVDVKAVRKGFKKVAETAATVGRGLVRCFGKEEFTEEELDLLRQILRLQKNEQIGGSHYQVPIQPITYCTLNKLPFAESNAIKYISRHAQLKKSEGKKSLLKAINYIERVLAFHYPEEGEKKDAKVSE